VDEGECKGNIKGGNDRIGMVQSKLEVSEKGLEGETGTGLNSLFDNKSGCKHASFSLLDWLINVFVLFGQRSYL